MKADEKCIGMTVTLPLPLEPNVKAMWRGTARSLLNHVLEKKNARPLYLQI